MKNFGIWVAVAVLNFVIAQPATPQINLTLDPKNLIDDFTAVDCPFPGVSDTGTFGGFLGEDASTHPSATVLVNDYGDLKVPAGCRPAAVMNVIRSGPAALPALLLHIDDKRPTKLVLGQDFSNQLVTFGGQFFGDEYDPRRQSWPRCGADNPCGQRRAFEKPYTVRVGDICFVLIGQIVNRQLNAVRYQPSDIVMVNSPIETPSLAARVRTDWSGIDSEGLKASLLADLHMTRLENAPDAETETGVLEQVHWGALRRLRYYFPAMYASLTGKDLEMRSDFEKVEARLDRENHQ